MKHTKETANEIRKKLEEHVNTTQFTQFNSMNFYIGELQVVETKKDVFLVIPLKSYRTIVGYVDYETRVLYEIGKYSRTTSKQITVYHNHSTLKERVFIPRIY